jgi:hypothetical protein
MIDNRTKELIDAYYQEAKKYHYTTQDFVWTWEVEKSKPLQAEICKWVFLNYPGCKVENLGWGFRIKNIQ